VVLRLADLMGRPAEELRIVSVHLGNGASACAVQDGRSIDTSMGFTPLEGLVMGTRSGDLDPAVILHVMGREELGVADATALLNKHSGLQGLSGISSDMRDLLEEEAEGSERAKLALDVYTYRVRKYIGAYAAVLGGVDAIGFTGGVGQNSAVIRARCLEGLGFLGVDVDGPANEALTGGEEGFFHAGPVATAAIRTGEELVIALEAERLAGVDPSGDAD
jgi:acetate kinase